MSRFVFAALILTACPRPDVPAPAQLQPLPAIHPAHPGAHCRRWSETVERVHMGEPVDECDLRNIIEAEEEIEYLRRARDLEGGYCWDELELCESGIVSERASRGHESTRFQAVIDDLESCARAAEGPS